MHGQFQHPLPVATSTETGSK